MKRTIDLNCDMGEGYGAWRMGEDEAVLEHVTSANVACGFHAGDPATIRRTVQAALARGVAVGAHPSLPDLPGFGRRVLAVTPAEVYEMVLYQIGALHAFARALGGRMTHVKPHGALYNMAAKDAKLAAAIAEAVRDFDSSLLLVGLAGSESLRAGRAAGLAVAAEAFADRTYQPDATLTPRTRPGALIEDIDASLEQVRRMVQEGKVIALDGSALPIEIDTLCIHGDQPGAVAFARRIRAELSALGVEVRAAGAR